MTSVVISQPFYFPWVGFMAQLSLADTLIWLDDVQFSKGSFVNRVQLNNAQTGNTNWLSVPLAGKGAKHSISALSACDADWKNKHRSAVENSLKDTEFFDDALNIFNAVMDEENLMKLLCASSKKMAEYMEIWPKKIVFSSEMSVSSKGSERVLDMVKKVGGKKYVTGHGAANYLNHEAFEQAGISVDYMDYKPKVWPQSGSTFTPFVSTLDLIARRGKSSSEHLCPQVVNWEKFNSGENINE